MEIEGDEAALLAMYGVTDAIVGRDRAWQAREYILNAGSSLIPTGPINMEHLILAGLVARAQGLHEASIAAIDSQNPHAAFTLLRAYAEHCAAILYLTDHPQKAKNLWSTDGPAVKIGPITNYAHRSGRLPRFKDVYDRLSKYAHPSPLAHFANFQVDEGTTFTWQSAPRFKRPEDQLVAYAWCIEFAYNAQVLMFEYAEKQGWGTFVQPE